MAKDFTFRSDIDFGASESKIQKLLKSLDKIAARAQKKVSVGVDTSKATGAAGLLDSRLKGIAGYAGKLSAFNPALGSMASGLGNVSSTGLKAAGAVAGVAGAFLLIGKAIQIGKEFDDKLNQSIAIMGDVSDTMRDKMGETAKQVALDTNIAASDAAESYFFLASAGLNAEQSISALPQVALFAKAGMFDMATATDLATDAQSALGLSSKDAQENLDGLTRVTDVFVKANTLANTSVEQISKAFTNKAGTAAAQLGIDVEEAAAGLLVFADKGVKGEKAGEQLAIVYRDLGTAARTNAAEFDKFGVSVYDDNGEFRNTADVIGDLEVALDGMSDKAKAAALSQLGFKDKSQAALLTLLGSSQKMREYEASLKNAGGTVEEIANKQMLSFSERIAQVTGFFENFALTIFDAVAPIATVFVDIGSAILSVVKPIVDLVAGASQFLAIGGLVILVLSKWGVVMAFLTGTIPKLIAMLITKGVVMARNVISTIADTAAKIANTVATLSAAAATGGFTAVLTALWVVMVANPIGAIIAGLVLLGGALFLLLGSGESVAEAMEGVDEAMSNTRKTISDTASTDAAAKANLKLADTYDRLEGSADPKSQKEFANAAGALAVAVPEAVRATGDLTAGQALLGAATGEASEDLEISTDVVRAMSEETLELNRIAREGALAELGKETEDLTEATRNAKEEVADLSKKKDEIIDRIEKMKALGTPYGDYKAEKLAEDLREVTIELGEQAAEVKAGNDKIRETVKLYKSQGKSIKEIADLTGDTVEETKKHVAAIEATEKAEKAAAVAASGLTETTYDASNAAASLAAAWNNANKAINEALNNSVAALNQFKLARLQAEGGVTEQAKITGSLLGRFGVNGKTLDAAYQTSLTKTAQQIAAEKKLRDSIDAATKAELGLSTTSEKGAKKSTASKLKEIDLYKDILDLIKQQADLKGAAVIANKTDRFALIEAEHQERLRKIKEESAAERRAVRADIAERLKLKGDAAQTFIDTEAALTDDQRKKLNAAELVQIDSFYEQRDKLTLALEKDSAREREKARSEALLDMFDRETELYVKAQEEALNAQREIITAQREVLNLDTVIGVEFDTKLAIDELELAYNEKADELAKLTPAFRDGAERIRIAVAAGLTTPESAVEEEQALLRSIILDEQKKTGTLLNIEHVRYLREKEKLEKDSLRRIIEIERAALIDSNALLRIALALRSHEWDSYYDELKKKREEDAEDAAKDQKEAVANLQKSLASGDINRSEFTKQLSALSGDIEATANDSAEFWKATGRAVSGSLDTIVSGFETKAAETGQIAVDAFTQTDEELTAEGKNRTDENAKAWNKIGDSAINTAGAVSASLVQLALTTNASLDDFAKGALQIALKAIKAEGSIFIAAIVGKSFATSPLLGAVISAGAIAAFQIALSAAEVAVAGFRSGGYTGRGGHGDTAGVVHKEEFVMNAPLTRNHRALFDAIHRGEHPLFAAMRLYDNRTLPTPQNERTAGGVMIDAGLRAEVQKLRASMGDMATRTEVAIQGMAREIDITRKVSVEGSMTMDTRQVTASLKEKKRHGRKGY